MKRPSSTPASATRLSDYVVVGQYQYDALSRRVQKIADASGTPATTQYYYDDTRIVEEQTPGGATQATYVYGNYMDEILNMDRGGQSYYYHQNELWSVEAITNAAGAVAERYSYDAYGLPNTGSTNSWGTPHSVIGNPWMSTGRQFEEETGLYNYRARYYDPVKDRFLQRDVADYEGGINLYRYVDDGPTVLVDPDGDFECFPGATNCLGHATGYWAVQPAANESFKQAMTADGWKCKESVASEDCSASAASTY